MRKPIVSGQFYASDFNELNKQIEESFKGKRGPGLVKDRGVKKIYGVISPHAGYMFSGACEAWSYKEIGESIFPKRYVVIGINHSGHGESEIAVSNQDFEMPFGNVKVDYESVKKLISECKFVKEDDLAHKFEHSVEVQLPFLQYVSKDNLDKLKIVPVVINEFNYNNIKLFAKVLSELDDFVVISSSDFTHYGENYGYKPFSKDVKKELYNLDRKAIEFILNLDSGGFLNYLEKTKATICGYSSIVACIETVKRLGCKKGRLLHYYTSGDVTKDYGNAVGYGGIVFD